MTVRKRKRIRVSILINLKTQIPERRRSSTITSTTFKFKHDGATFRACSHATARTPMASVRHTPRRARPTGIASATRGSGGKPRLPHARARLLNRLTLRRAAPAPSNPAASQRTQNPQSRAEGKSRPPRPTLRAELTEPSGLNVVLLVIFPS